MKKTHLCSKIVGTNEIYVFDVQQQVYCYSAENLWVLVAKLHGFVKIAFTWLKPANVMY